MVACIHICLLLLELNTFESVQLLEVSINYKSCVEILHPKHFVGLGLSREVPRKTEGGHISKTASDKKRAKQDLELGTETVD